MIQFKNGVSLYGIQPQLLLAIRVAEAEYEARGLPLVITSVNDGKHKANSLHYSGRGVDLRTRNLPPYDQKPIYESLVRILSPVGFDVVWEDRGGPNQHFHVEYDPKDRLAQSQPVLPTPGQDV